MDHALALLPSFVELEEAVKVSVMLQLEFAATIKVLLLITLQVVPDCVKLLAEVELFNAPLTPLSSAEEKFCAMPVKLVTVTTADAPLSAADTIPKSICRGEIANGSAGVADVFTRSGICSGAAMDAEDS